MQFMLDLTECEESHQFVEMFPTCITDLICCDISSFDMNGKREEKKRSYYVSVRTM